MDHDAIRKAIETSVEAVGGYDDPADEAADQGDTGGADDEQPADDGDAAAGAATGDDAGDADAAGDADGADEADAAGESGEGDAEADGSPDASAEEQPRAEATKPSKDDATKRFEKEHGIASHDKRGRENRIPHSRVVKITENAVKKAETRWKTDVLAPVAAKADIYEKRLDRIAVVENMMFKEQDAFLDKLLTIPGYTELLQQRFGGGAGSGKGSADAAAADFELPPPANGEGYTLQELGGILNSFGKSVEARTIAAVKKDVDSTYGTVKKSHDDAAQQAEFNTQRQTYISEMLNEAAQWEGFNENADAILKAVQADTRKIESVRDFDRILGDAYRKVVFGKQQTTRAAVRKELKQAPRATSTGARAAGKPGAPKSSGNPIRDAIVNSLPAGEV